MKIPISEIFHSLQGEGRNTGKPSIFIRFWGCNLSCSWCDSKYAWDPKVEKPQMMDLDIILEKIKSFNCKHIIFTGGEPTLFQEQIQIIQDKLTDYTYEIETNGSQELQIGGSINQINISPKLGMSGNREYEIRIFKTKGFTGNKDLKFVIGNLDNIKEMEDFLKKYKTEVRDMRIYLMPLGRDTKSQINKIIIDYCVKKGYNYCMRNHLIRFGDGKGV